MKAVGSILDDPSLPADIRRACIGAELFLAERGFPPRGPDGLPCVLLAEGIPGAVTVDVFSLSEALGMIPHEPDTQRKLRRAAEDIADARGVVAFLVGTDETFWCLPMFAPGPAAGDA